MKLLDLLNEVEKEEKQVKEISPINEAEKISVDEIGKFFVVEKPNKNSGIDDIVYESTIADFALKVKDGLEIKNLLGVYKQKSDARRAGTEALKAFQDQLKEMEDAMEEFRSADRKSVV
jgi:hypothetical protein